jgi:hypothetical protein
MALFDMDQQKDIVVVEENNMVELLVVVEVEDIYDDMVVEYIEDHYRNEFDVLLEQMMMEN